MMIHFTKRLYAMIFAVCCMSQTMQSNDICDEQGRTEIINYLIQQEKEIALKKSELEKLCKKYFAKNYKTKMLEKKAWVTDENITHYRNMENELDCLLEETIKNIKMMVVDGASLQSRDLGGLSISDYCKTNEIYYVLRELGAPITLNEQFWGAIVGGVVITSAGAVIITAAAVVATACYRAYFPQ